MPSLSELQRGFARALVEGVPSGALAVYRGNFYGNAVKALASAYPVVAKIVGQDFFEAMAREFVRRHPAACGDLNRYGEDLAAFLERFPHTSDLPYLPHVARMEWLVHRAHFAADPPAFELSGRRPVLAPACALMESAWPLARIWEFHQDDYTGPFEIDLGAGPDRILVHRPRWRVIVMSLRPGDYAFLNCVSRGRTLAEALEAGDTDEHFDPATALARWLEARVIARLV